MAEAPGPIDANSALDLVITDVALIHTPARNGSNAFLIGKPLGLDRWFYLAELNLQPATAVAFNGAQDYWKGKLYGLTFRGALRMLGQEWSRGGGN